MQNWSQWESHNPRSARISPRKCAPAANGMYFDPYVCSPAAAVGLRDAPRRSGEAPWGSEGEGSCCWRGVLAAELEAAAAAPPVSGAPPVGCTPRGCRELSAAGRWSLGTGVPRPAGAPWGEEGKVGEQPWVDAAPAAGAAAAAGPGLPLGRSAPPPGCCFDCTTCITLLHLGASPGGRQLCVWGSGAHPWLTGWLASWQQVMPVQLPALQLEGDWAAQGEFQDFGASPQEGTCCFAAHRCAYRLLGSTGCCSEHSRLSLPRTLAVSPWDMSPHLAELGGTFQLLTTSSFLAKPPRGPWEQLRSSLCANVSLHAVRLA